MVTYDAFNNTNKPVDLTFIKKEGEEYKFIGYLDIKGNDIIKVDFEKNIKIKFSNLDRNIAPLTIYLFDNSLNETRGEDFWGFPKPGEKFEKNKDGNDINRTIDGNFHVLHHFFTGNRKVVTREINVPNNNRQSSSNGSGSTYRRVAATRRGI